MPWSLGSGGVGGVAEETHDTLFSYTPDGTHAWVVAGSSVNGADGGAGLEIIGDPEVTANSHGTSPTTIAETGGDLVLVHGGAAGAIGLDITVEQIVTKYHQREMFFQLWLSSYVLSLTDAYLYFTLGGSSGNPHSGVMLINRSTGLEVWGRHRNGANFYQVTEAVTGTVTAIGFKVVNGLVSKAYWSSKALPSAPFKPWEMKEVEPPTDGHGAHHTTTALFENPATNTSAAGIQSATDDIFIEVGNGAGTTANISNIWVTAEKQGAAT